MIVTETKKPFCRTVGAWICRGQISRVTVALALGIFGYLMYAKDMPKPYLILNKIRNIDEKTLTVRTLHSSLTLDKERNGTFIGNVNIEPENALNITKEELEELFESKWNRSANVTQFPIPSYNNRYEMKCSPVCSNALFIYIVQTATKHFLQRSIIRQTWGNKYLFKENTFELVFLLGKPKNESVQKLLKQEQYFHHDLVQGTFLDSYKNLTHKSVLGLRWVTENCPGVKFIIRVDDDVFVNTFKLIELLDKKYANVTREMIGKVFPTGHGIIQRSSGKWKVDNDEFKNMTRYPFPYLNGPFGIITSDLIVELFAASKLVNFFWIEDVYIYGLLAQVVGNVKHTGLGSALKITGKDGFDEMYKCFQSESTKCNKMVAYPLTTDKIYDLWWPCFYQFRTSGT